MGSKSDAELNRLIQESEAAIKRVESLQKAKNAPIAQKVTTHVKKQGNNLANVVLAGTLFGVAYLRLHDKWSYQAEQEKWQEEKDDLQKQVAKLQSQLTSCEQTVSLVESAAASGPRNVQTTLRTLLDGCRSVGSSEIPSSGSSRVSATLVEDPRELQQDSNKKPGRFLA